MQDEQFKELLERYTDGNCTVEEISWLESAYLNWNKDNGQSFTEEQLVNAQQLMWDKVAIATTPVATTRLWPRIAAAAAILVFLSAGILFFWKSGIPAGAGIENLTREKDIAPGSNKAILTLANGKKINLTDIAVGKLANESGVKITKSKSGQLEYTIIDQSAAAEKAVALNTISTPRGGQYKVILPDGTGVWLNAASSLTYPSSFSGTAKRAVELKGEAYFEVTHNPAQPFVVKTAQQEVEVLGTHFNINAYAEEPAARTTLLEGSVRLNQHTVLKPGEQAISVGNRLKVNRVDIATAVDWKNGDFALIDDDFRTTMRKVARWYDVDLVYDDSAPERLKLGGWISRSKNISSILKLMELTGKVHFKVEGRRITITK